MASCSSPLTKFDFSNRSTVSNRDLVTPDPKFPRYLVYFTVCGTESSSITLSSHRTLQDTLLDIVSHEFEVSLKRAVNWLKHSCLANRDPRSVAIQYRDTLVSNWLARYHARKTRKIYEKRKSMFPREHEYNRTTSVTSRDGNLRKRNCWRRSHVKFERSASLLAGGSNYAYMRACVCLWLSHIKTLKVQSPKILDFFLLFRNRRSKQHSSNVAAVIIAVFS